MAFEMPVFRSPELLWLLLLAPLFLFSFRRKHSRARGAVVKTVRILVYACLVIVLAEPAFKRTNDAVTTYFVVDRSGSIPEESREWCLHVIQESVAKKKDKDRAGIVVFGDQAIVEESPTEHFEVRKIISVVDDSNTDVSAAVRLALSTFPEDTQKRIVLFTDGNQTKGDLTSAVQRAAAARVPIDVVPLKYHYPDEVLVDNLSIPRKVQKEEPFQIRANVKSLGDGKGRLRIFSDGQMIGQRDVQLRAGDNVFLFSHTLQDSGFHLFEAEITADDDGLLQNNRAQAYTIIEDEPLVLLAGNTQEDVRHVAEALKEEGIDFRIRLAGSLPRDLGEWQSYDAIIFANLGAEYVTLAQMEMIESLVNDLGAGFIMVGGEKSFGAGGYMGTPIDKLLPVNLDIEQKKILPNGGIAFVLDHVHCIGDRWSKDICVGTVNGLTKFDSFGLLVGDRSDWVLPLEPAANKEHLTRYINSVSVPDVHNPDAQLDRIIAGFARSKCSYRHAVLITDARMPPPSSAAVTRLRNAKITLSVVVIEPRGTPSAFRAVAQQGGGNFYVVHPHQYSRVPQIWIKESALVKKGLYFEETITPVMKEWSEILEGIGPSDLPPLHGYNVSSRKDPTEIPLVAPDGDAILAHWQYGLGRTVAFTSDATTKWGRDWVSWSKFKQFWAQAVRWCQRRMEASPYQLTLQRGAKDGTCEAILDAQDEDGRFVNFLSPRGMLVKPDLKSDELGFEQIGPGRYKAVFPVDRTGGYVVNVQYTQNGKPYLLRGGYVPPYNPEYARFEDNEPVLLSVAERSGGRPITPEMDLFAATGQVAYTTVPIWPFLLLLAVCLFPFDVFVRRVIIGPRDILAIFPRFRKKSTQPDALSRERAAVRTRSVFVPSYATEAVSSEGPPVQEEVEEEGPPPAEIEMMSRLKKAKDEARKKFNK